MVVQLLGDIRCLKKMIISISRHDIFLFFEGDGFEFWEIQLENEHGNLENIRKDGRKRWNCIKGNF